MSDKNTLKNTFNNFIDDISKLGLFKEIIIIFIIFLIILTALYDKILPLFIQIEVDFLNNLISIIPLFICIVVFMLAICSHFKIFGKNTLFQFNHKILNFNKYKTVINRKIENYKNKLYKIKDLYNQNQLVRNKIKTNIANLTENNKNLNNMSEKLMKECVDINEKNKKLTDVFIDKTRENIEDLAFKGKTLFDSTVAIREARMLKAEQNAKTATQRQQSAASFEVLRQKLIQDELARRNANAAKERLRRARMAQQRKNTWLKQELKNIDNRFKNDGLALYLHPNHQGYCGTMRPNLHHDHGTICHGHDVISSIKVPQFLVVDLWQHNHSSGHGVTLRGAETGWKGYNMSTFHLDNTISSIRTRYDGESYARLARAKLRAKLKPLSHFGNLVVEGKMAPGLNKHSTKFG